jgi:hypothetical protein
MDVHPSGYIPIQSDRSTCDDPTDVINRKPTNNPKVFFMFT